MPRVLIADALSPDLALPTVATRDIAAVAARLLLDTAWSGQEEVPVLGPEDLSANEMAAVVSEVLGTPVRYRHISREEFTDRFAGMGLSDAMVQGMLEMLVAKENGLDGKSYAEVVAAPATVEMVDGYVKQLNEGLQRWQTIKKFRLLPRDLDVEHGEITPSLKVKRLVVERGYKHLIDEMYAGTREA